MENSKAFIEAKIAIKELDEAYGYPEKNDGRDTTTETKGYDLAVYDSEDKDHQEAVYKYNIELEILAAMIDKRHVGSNIWYTSYYKTEEFSKFAEEAEPIIEHFIEAYEW